MGSKYLVFDLETENHSLCGRKASPFDPRNFIVATGYELEGDTPTGIYYTDVNGKENKFNMFLDKIPDDVDILVGLNIKFDLHYVWDFPAIKEFFKRGGKIWCCQLAEFCLGGMLQEFHTVSMDKIVGKYGGNTKLDEVKQLWEAGYLTSEIDRDMLMKYLLEVGDIPNTRKIYLGQLAKAKEMGMLTVIEQRMESLLATTEMEYNGITIDTAIGITNAKELKQQLNKLTAIMNSFVKGLPKELEFNWNSGEHRSALMFGGSIKYKYKDAVVDDDGNVVRNKSGKAKGEVKTKLYESYHTFKRMVTPNEDWKGAKVDCCGKPFYSTDADTLDALVSMYPDNLLFKAFRKYQVVNKDLGEYYISKDTKGNLKGMLTKVNPHDGRIHHSLHHVRTVTGRLSSSNPNCQTIPRDDEDKDGKAKSRVKEMFVSRFKDNGYIIEADYSQLEVVVQGALTKDKQLCEDLRNRIDFHCKRLAAKLGEDYNEVKKKCKDDKHPEHSLYKKLRSNIKQFTFQRSYGAGKYKISASTGMALKDVEELIINEDALYPGVNTYYEGITKEIQDSSMNHFVFKPALGRTIRVGTYVTPTGTRYCFEQQKAPDFLAKKGIDYSFSPTCIKNYPIQGTGGEMVETILGKLFRHFVANNNYGGKAFLINTVHDCVWVDTHKDVTKQVAEDIKPIMESIPQVYKELYGWDINVPFPVDVEAGKSLFVKTHLENI